MPTPHSFNQQLLQAKATALATLEELCGPAFPKQPPTRNADGSALTYEQRIRLKPFEPRKPEPAEQRINLYERATRIRAAQAILRTRALDPHGAPLPPERNPTDSSFRVNAPISVQSASCTNAPPLPGAGRVLGSEADESRESSGAQPSPSGVGSSYASELGDLTQESAPPLPGGEGPGVGFSYAPELGPPAPPAERACSMHATGETFSNEPLASPPQKTTPADQPASEFAPPSEPETPPDNPPEQAPQGRAPRPRRAPPLPPPPHPFDGIAGWREGHDTLCLIRTPPRRSPKSPDD